MLELDDDKPRDHAGYMAELRRRDGWPDMAPADDKGKRRHTGIESIVWGADGKDYNAALCKEKPHIYVLKRRPRGNGTVDHRYSISLEKFVEAHDALQFANRMGYALDVCLTIAWFMLPGCDQRSCQIFLDRFLKNFGQWLRDRLSSGDPDRRSVFLYVSENPGGERPHTHLLLAIPEPVRGDFRSWAPSALERVIGRALPPKFLRMHVPRVAGGERQWRWFHYLMKGADPSARLGPHGKDLLGDILLFAHQNPGPLNSLRRLRISPSLSKAQRQLFDGRDQAPWHSSLHAQIASGQFDVRTLYSDECYRFGCAWRRDLPRVHEDAEGPDDAVLKHISPKLLWLRYQSALEERRLNEEANNSGYSVDDALRPFHL